MARRRFLTPNVEEEADTNCRPLSIPFHLLASVGGALTELTDPNKWEPYGTMTPEEAAEICTVMLANWIEECGETGPCICEVPADPELGIEINIRIIRRGPGGHTQELVDGEWVTPTGDYEVPDIPARTEATEPDRLCLAAANAANVLADMYEEITDAIAIELSAASVFSAIYDYAIAILGLFAGATAAAYASLGKTFFDIFVETADTLGSDVWDGGFTDELKCFMLSYAQDDGFGHITFEWPVMREAITDKFLEAGGALDADRALLWGQVGYLFDILAADGIDMAGSTTAIEDDDCACSEGWCRYFNFNGSAHAWYPILTGGGAACAQRVSNAYWAPVVIAGQVNLRIGITLLKPCVITRIILTGTHWSNVPTEYFGGNQNTAEYITLSNASGAYTFNSGPISIECSEGDIIRLDNYRNISSGDWAFTTVTIEGTGLMPFSTGVEC